MQQIKKILFILTLLISSLVWQVLAEGVSCYRSGGITDNENPELNQFYYHSDHLGSSSYITNLSGNIVQHIEYVPFGEVFLEERNNKWNTPYLFNGKELDEETGLYYYGARYYSSRNSIFLSVDRFAEKYPGVSPYQYCLNNPINALEINGDSILIGNFIDRLLNAIGIKTDYVKKVEQDIYDLKNMGDDEIKNMIETLENSDNIHSIINTEKDCNGNSCARNKKKAEEGVPQGSTIRYNPNKKTTKANDYRPPKVGLSHEMQHSYDADQGTTNFNTINDIPLHEIKAVKMENRVRKYMMIHRRIKYGGRNIPRGMLRDDYIIR